MENVYIQLLYTSRASMIKRKKGKIVNILKVFRFFKQTKKQA